MKEAQIVILILAIIISIAGLTSDSDKNKNKGWIAALLVWQIAFLIEVL